MEVRRDGKVVEGVELGDTVTAIHGANLLTFRFP